MRGGAFQEQYKGYNLETDRDGILAPKANMMGNENAPMVLGIKDLRTFHYV